MNILQQFQLIATPAQVDEMRELILRDAAVLPESAWTLHQSSVIRHGPDLGGQYRNPEATDRVELEFIYTAQVAGVPVYARRAPDGTFGSIWIASTFFPPED